MKDVDPCRMRSRSMFASKWISNPSPARRRVADLIHRKVGSQTGRGGRAPGGRRWQTDCNQSVPNRSLPRLLCFLTWVGKGWSGSLGSAGHSPERGQIVAAGCRLPRDRIVQATGACLPVHKSSVDRPDEDLIGNLPAAQPANYALGFGLISSAGNFSSVAAPDECCSFFAFSAMSRLCRKSATRNASVFPFAASRSAAQFRCCNPL